MKSKRFFFGSGALLTAAVFTLVFLLSFSACQKEPKTMLMYQGRSSLRLISKEGTVVYVDPYIGDGYNVPADIILVTHGHDDHNRVNMVTKKDDCVIFSYFHALKDGAHGSAIIKDIEIKSVEAYNGNHNIKDSVGFIITIDGIKVYAAGDTDMTEQMKTLAAENIDYAFLPCDGRFNMGPEEAAECAKIIGAKHNIPYHTSQEFPGGSFDKDNAERFNAPNRLILEPGTEIALKQL